MRETIIMTVKVLRPMQNILLFYYDIYNLTRGGVDQKNVVLMFQLFRERLSESEVCSLAHTHSNILNLCVEIYQGGLHMIKQPADKLTDTTDDRGEETLCLESH